MFDIKPITSPIQLDCGPTCLQMLLSYYGIESKLEDLNNKCNIDLIGCTAKDLQKIGNEYGLDIKAYEMSMEELLEQDRPAIIWWKRNHFCIFCGLDEDNRIMIINPDRGLYAIPKPTFKTYYSGVSLFNGEPKTIEKEPTIEDKFNALMEYMNLQGHLENNVFVIEKKEYSADNPIIWEEGMTPENNAFYLKEDGKIYVYMNGEWIEW